MIFYATLMRMNPNNLFRQVQADANLAVDAITDCCQSVKSWMNANMLKLNEDKTESILMGPKWRRDKINCTSLRIGNSDISLSSSVKDLGVILDNDLSMESNVNHTAKICYMHIHNISKIRKFISKDATITLVRSLVLSRLDYCNALLVGSPNTLINKLQRVQNAAARIVAMSHKREHVTPILRDLKWLPVQQRIMYKISCLTFQCLQGNAPEYLQERLVPYIPPRTLRSQVSNLLRIPRTTSMAYGERSFSYAAAVQWNHLPERLRL